MHTFAVDADFDEQRVRIGHLRCRHDLRPQRAEAVARLRPHRGPVVRGQRQAEVGSDQVAGNDGHRVIGTDAAGRAADDDDQRRADLQRRLAFRHDHHRAVAGQRVARLDRQHRCARRRLVRRLVHGIAQRSQLHRIVQQRAGHHAAHAKRRSVEAQQRKGHADRSIFITAM